MTWDLTQVTRAPHPDPKLALLLQSVEMVFAEFDSNGIATGKTRTYTEPNVSDVSDAGIAKLARDQLRQLEKISSTQAGAADLSAIKALVTPPAPPRPSDDEIAAEAFQTKRVQFLELKALVADGIVDANDDEYTRLLSELRSDAAAIRQKAADAAAAVK